MRAWLLLLLAIVCDVAATSLMKASDGFRKPVPTVIMAIGYAISFTALSYSLKQIPLGVAYACWTGLGVVGTVLVGKIFWNENLTLIGVLGFLLILSGVVLLNISSRAVQ
ncbi:MAG: multidrug efflux SMR transporter [Blastocatellia bacterium]|nr:multidrug efflux SMR transporter [Blastocatellia bacterium]